MPSPMETEVESSTAMIRTTSPTERSGVLRNTVQHFTCRIPSSYTFGLASQTKQMLAYLWAQILSLAELPQVSFLSRQTCVCHDETRLLSQQKYACHDKIMLLATNICCGKCFVPTKILCCDKHNFVATKDKHTFVATKDKHTFAAKKDVFCLDKHVLFTTKLLSG